MLTLNAQWNFFELTMPDDYRIYITGSNSGTESFSVFGFKILYGGNTLLAYVVGAGKTYTMVAAAMESKRLGLCHKSMIVVPNHIIEQFAAEWLQLYLAANLLVATIV